MGQPLAENEADYSNALKAGADEPEISHPHVVQDAHNSDSLSALGAVALSANLTEHILNKPLKTPV